MERCGANTKRGAVCNKPAGWGTPSQHGRCRLHGGASPTHQKAAQRREAQRAVEQFGLPREVEPHEALLEEVHRAAGHVAWLGEVVRTLEKNQVVHGITRSVQLPDGTRTVEARAAVNIWVKLYQEERDRLVRVAKAAIDAGVEARQVRLAEAQAEQLAQVIRAILTDLGQDLADEQVRKAVRFRLVEGGSSA
jgi:cell division FtsZ-interacting protein ZapD